MFITGVKSAGGGRLIKRQRALFRKRSMRRTPRTKNDLRRRVPSYLRSDRRQSADGGTPQIHREGCSDKLDRADSRRKRNGKRTCRACDCFEKQPIQGTVRRRQLSRTARTPSRED